MKICIIAEEIDDFRRQAIQAIGKMAASYGHSVTIYTQYSISGHSLTGLSSVRHYHEPDYCRALVHEMDALIAFSSREWDYAAGHAPHIAMVTILHDHSEIEKLSGEVRCIWVDHRLVIIEELAYQALLACELPQPFQPQIVRLEPRVALKGSSGP